MLSLLPKRHRVSQSRSPLLGDRQSATSPPSLGPERNQSFRFERPQIPSQGAPVHTHEFGKRGNRQCIVGGRGDQDGKLRGSKPYRAQRIIVGARHCASRGSHSMAGAVGKDFALRSQDASFTCRAYTLVMANRLSMQRIMRPNLNSVRYFKLGKLNSAPPRMPVGQRAVTVFSRV
jgi:hypothetical protein